MADTQEGGAPPAVVEAEAADDGGVETPLVKGTDASSRIARHMVRRPTVRLYVESLKPFAVSFQDLSVYVPREKGCCPKLSSLSMSCCSCFLSPLSYWMVEKFGWAVEQKSPYYALQETSGFVNSGEMVLVLSPDTQYASALIQSLTGRLSDKYEVCGNIRVNGSPIPTQAFQGWRRIAAHVSSDDGTHAPVLTVRETLRFAAECTHPAEYTAEKIDDVVNEVMEILDLTSAADTVVGDENLRGISGGQKRRVTVGEMLVARGTRFLGLENITDGLSSQDSFNIVKELKSACECFDSAAVISLNQPSDEIVELFDNILVLNDQGELTYFGPPSDRAQLQEMFLSEKQGEETDTAMSICDLCLSPMTDEAAAEAIKEKFLDSPLYGGLLENLQELSRPKKFETHVQDLLPKTKYASGLLHNFNILGKRRSILIRRNPSTYLRIGVAIFFGVVIGSLFSVLKQDIASSMARSAYLFQNLFLVLLLSTGVTVPQNIRDRVTYYKHRSSEFYSARVYYVCQVLYELPLSIIEAILLSVTSYWWVDMNPDAGRFFFFLGVMIATEFVGLALGRLFCAISRTQVVAKSVVSVLTLLFATVAGFMPSYNQIPTILRWMSWISPPAYGFEALAINEYVGRELAGLTLGLGGTDTTVGTVPGEQWLQMLGLPRVAWTSLQGIKIFDIIMLFILTIAFDILGYSLMERSRKNFFSQLRRPQRFSRSLSFVPDTGKEGVPEPLKWPTSLSISNLCYFVPLKGETPKRCTLSAICGPLLLGGKKGKEEVARTKEIKELQLLNNITATFGAGRATALMGTSGAGKTTLLDVIAGYKTGGRITGDLTLNGIPKDKKIWTLLAGYAEQQDIVNPYLTVLETMKFTASCRLPASMNRAAIIDNVIALMSLEDWTDYVVGDEKDGEGIPKHVRKRLTIAVQLVMLPKILFLDEPTTGLGTSAANLVMDAIRRSTTEMKLITVATIHQPSKLIWESFDDLLLLTKGGKVAYMGEMGPKSQKVINYFSNLASTPKPENSCFNPADYVISAVSSVTPDEAQSSFASSKEQEEVAAKLKEQNDMSGDEKQAVTDMMQKAKADLGKRKSALRELFILTKRQLITQWRNPSYSVTRIFCSLGLAVYFGILFGGDKSTLEGAILTIGATFFLVFILVVPMQAAVVPLIADRAVLYREATSGLYSRASYAIASLLADIPFHALNCVLMYVGFYFLAGFKIEGEAMGYFIAMIFLCNWAFTSIGEVYAITTPNEEAANGLAGLTTILSVLFMGFLIQVPNMPDYWKWANTADLLRYVIQGLTSNEMGDNHYKLFPDDATSNMTFFGDIGNATEVFLFQGGEDTSPGSDADQASNLLNLLLQVSPAGTADWNSSFVGVLENFVDCGMRNECFVDPIATSFVGCFLLSLPWEAPPCGEEWNALIGSLGQSADKALSCLGTTFLESIGDGIDSIGDSFGGGANETSTGGSTNGTIESADEFAAQPLDFQDKALLCILNAVLPAGLLEQMVKWVEGIIEDLTGVATVVIDILDVLEKGLPGEVILFVFGWAEFDDGKLVAPWKWWYCLFAVAMFVLGVEFFKLVGTVFIVWTNR